ncbi:hypothetical protein OEZ85_000664 [Tetradesmus obliquus]|uniref:MYND-type domain-containing protein n=1 Tax=Tetradesmus obliquus TaxID=3088 RepID=A0ABY8UIW1_TETOB|nr:hypothetical protein OEZ85_000664 [Tetradesmus obliquus]
MSSTEDLLERAERAFEQHLQPVYNRDEIISSSKLFAKLVQAVRGLAGKLPFDNLQDAGAVYEWWMLYYDQDFPSLPAPPSRSEQLDSEMRNRFAQEELREAAWLAAGQHGFAALAGIPELQQLVQRCCMQAVDESYGIVEMQSAMTDERFRTFLDGVPLLHLLVPQLRLCLLAEVAAGLLVPGHPLPPDTPEHGAALQYMLASAIHLMKHEGEVPLQAVVLLAALEQLQGLALVAVRQQDVQQALQAARAAAAAADEERQEKGEAASRSHRTSIAFSVEDSSEEGEDEGQQQQMQQQGQEQGQTSSTNQQQQQQQQQQQDPPNNSLLLLVQKLLDIIHLTRQFAELNAALNSSSSSSSSSSSGSVHVGISSNGSMAAADRSVSSNSDSEGDSPRNSSSSGGWFGSWQRQQQQQQNPEGASECAAAIKEGGQALRALDEMWRAAQMEPARKFVSQWLRETRQQQRLASDWWHDQEHGRAAWMQQQQSVAKGPAQDAAAAAGGVLSLQAWRDAFGWRRLLWGLLGRLKPTAQAWYVQYYGMCSHCPDHKLWAAVCGSLMRHLWVPPGADAVAWQLSGAHCPPRSAWPEQPGRMAQYARALNAAFKARAGSCEAADSDCFSSSHDAATMMSHQVLLSLSPLQHKLHPATEVTPLCPSSFMPAVNKLLQQQLGMAQLLHSALVRSGQPLMWHVWWHIGIRRYHWVQQQQQRQQQQQQQQDEEFAEDVEQAGARLGKAPQGTASKSSKARMKQRARKQQQQQQALDAAQQAGLAPLSAGQLAALYADPAARYYAAGFAARQTAAYGTGLRARAALRTPHMIASKVVSEKLQAARTFELLRELSWSSDGDELNSSLNVYEQLLAAQLQDADSTMRLGRPAFTPLFQPEGQVGPGNAALQDEGLLLAREGEAHQLMALGAVDCLVGPAAQQWWQRYQRLMMARCDACGEPLPEQQQQQQRRRGGSGGLASCATCGIPRYCSGACQTRDEPRHAALCGHLIEAQQRYSPTSSSSSSSTALRAVGAGAAAPRHHAWRVLQLLQPEPGPLGMACQAFAV